MGNCQRSLLEDDVEFEVATRATGKKKALLVGINYRGTGSALNGCINDIVNQKELLLSHYGFQEDDIMMLHEDLPKDKWPYKQAILDGFKWLYTGARPGDLLFFQYSGHGSQYQTLWENCDCICPLECMSQPWPGSVILDTEIHKNFYDALPHGCKAVAIFDCCHSGTIANLSVKRELKPEHKPKPRFLEPPKEAATTLPRNSRGIRKAVVSDQYVDKQLWVFSGCQDDQTSADAYCDGQYQGAFTWAMIKALKTDVYHETYIDLLDQIRNNLRGYTQMPALTTTHGSYLNAWYCGKMPGSAASVTAVDDAVGKKKALLIGINYRDTPNELRGCINDINNHKATLKKFFGYEESEMMMLSEDESKENWPYKQRILEGFQWLLQGATEGDQLFLQYSGHGSQMTDRTGKEPSGLSDCICPLDCDKPWPAHIILDTEIHTYVYDKLPKGVKLTCLFDCCHSGTMANLDVNRGLRPATARAISSPEEYRGSRRMDPPRDVAEPAKIDPEGTDVGPPTGFRRAIQGHSDKLVWVYSGCQDEQTSADAYEDGMYQGAFSWAFRKAMEEHRWSMKHADLIVRIRSILRRRYTQIPALSTTKGDYFRRYYMSRQKGVMSSGGTSSESSVLCG